MPTTPPRRVSYPARKRTEHRPNDAEPNREAKELELYVDAVREEAGHIIAVLEVTLGERLEALSMRVDALNGETNQRFNHVIAEIQRLGPRFDQVMAEVQKTGPRFDQVIAEVQQTGPRFDQVVDAVRFTQNGVAGVADSINAQKPILLDIQKQIQTFIASGSQWAQLPDATTVDLVALQHSFLSRIHNDELRHITDQLFARSLKNPTQDLHEEELREVWRSAEAGVRNEIAGEPPGPARAGKTNALDEMVSMLRDSLIRLQRTVRDLAGARS